MWIIFIHHLAMPTNGQMISWSMILSKCIQHLNTYNTYKSHKLFANDFKFMRFFFVFRFPMNSLRLSGHTHTSVRLQNKKKSKTKQKQFMLMCTTFIAPTLCTLLYGVHVHVVFGYRNYRNTQTP